jgi:transcriptional regulator with XRE-family HTH domain
MFLIIDNITYLNKIRNIMPARLPAIANTAAAPLIELGKQIRARRKALRINATTAAGAAGMSRVTLHRIEKGKPSVTMGAYLNAMAALGMDFGIVHPAGKAAAVSSDDFTGLIPARIRLADYPQLKQLAWQVQGVDELTPMEALSIYERNGRHLDTQAMAPREQQLLEALRLGLGGTAIV